MEVFTINENKNILIIEDYDEMAELLKLILTQEGYKTKAEQTGHDGIKEALKGGYDLLILDIILPDLEGIEVCKKIRQHGCNIPILCLTVMDYITEKARALNVGADDYLTKPFDPEELLARIKALLRRGKNSSYSVLEIEDLKIIDSQQKIKRGNKEITLTKTEVIILLYLIEKKDTVVKKEELVALLKEHNLNIKDNVIYAHVKNLRRKINEGFDKKLIKNVYGSGYCL